MKTTQLNYRPKPAKGISFPGHIRITRAQLHKWLEAGNLFNGFIVGNNVNSFHFFGGWHLAHRIESRNAEEMAETISGFQFYLEPELGSRAAIFLRKPRSVRKMAFVPVSAMLPSLL